MIYSGTVSAAHRRIHHGLLLRRHLLPRARNSSFDAAAEYASAPNTSREDFPPVLLNVNVPPVPREEIKGVRLTRQGRMQFREFFDQRQDPSGRTYYWLTGEVINIGDDPDIDSIAVSQNYISITPIHYNLTDENLLRNLRAWKFEQ